ncbi:MAG: hypothetical protein ACKOAA_03515 [Actinomycetota bacterium]
MEENQQLCTTELASETAEINDTPLCEELEPDTKHRRKNKWKLKQERVANDLQLLDG